MIPNPFSVPKLEKITIIFSLGSFLKKGGELETAVNMLTLITGQKPSLIKSRVSVANFKLRAGMISALKVTLRKDKMMWFLSRLIHIAMPRLYNFWGVSDTAHDNVRSFSVGLNDLSVFSEIGSRFNTKGNPGMNITFTTTARNILDTHNYLKTLGIPFVPSTAKKVKKPTAHR